MASIRDIFIRLGIKSDPRKLKQINQGINTIRDSALRLGSVLATGALAVGFRHMIDIASSMEEGANKFGAVFGDASSQVQKDLDGIRKRTGATNTELLEMASGIGALTKSALGSAEATGKLAAGVTELALDISSFNDVTSEEAIVALRAGLIGSAEPLQRFGVDLRVAALEQEAMRQGVGKLVKEMSEGERIQLRYAAIQRQLGAQGATGDATRTAKGFANASRNLGAAIKETAGIIGTFFLGSVGSMVNKTRELVDAFQLWLAANREMLQQRLDKFLDRGRRIISAIVSVVKRVATAVDDWVDSLGPLGKQLLDIAKVAAVIGVMLLLPGGSILLLIGLIALLIEDFETWRKGGESVTGDLVKGFMQLIAVAEEYRSKVVDAFRDVGEWARQNAVAIGFVTGAVLALAGAIGIKLVLANKAALASWVALKAFTVQYYAVLAAGAIKTAAITAAAQLKMAAGWLIAFGPIGVAIGLIGGLAGAIAVMFADAIKETGNWGDAFLLLADTAIEFWAKFFGAGEETIEKIKEIFRDFLEATFGGLGDLAFKFFGDDGAAGPGVARAAAGGAGSSNVSSTSQQTNTFTIVAPEGASPEAIAELIPPLLARAQEKENRAALRNFATAGGGA